MGAISCILGHRRRGFLFTMPLMLGMGILIFSSMIAISQLFVVIGGPMVPDLLADMPTIFDYTDEGKRAPQYVPLLGSGGTIQVDGADVKLSEKELAASYPSIAMYGLMVKIAIGIFVILMMLAGISYFFEEFNIVRPGTAYGILAKMVILIPIYLVLPYLWDTTALVIESSSLYLMDPFGGDPHARTTELWCMMGSVACSIDGTTVDPIEVFDDVNEYDKDNTLNQESWNESLQNPIFGEDFLVNVILSLFKGFAVMFMTAMMFILSAVRVMLTEIIVISFPLVTAIGLIPWINTGRISAMFQQNLVGLAMAPIMSAIVLSIGLATIDSQELPPLRMWFQLLSVGFLAVFFPVMLSPMLGNLSTRVGNMVSTSITSASVAGSGALRGITHGAGQAAMAMQGAGGAMAAAGAARASGGISSASVGTATSGANMGSISTLDKMRIYGSAGAAGMLGGLGSGMVQSTTQSMGVGGAASDVSGQMLHGADARIQNSVQGALANGAVRGISHKMTAAEHTTAPEIHHNHMMNPGTTLETMTDKSGSFDEGQALISNPETRTRFVDAARHDAGLDEASQEVKDEFEKKLGDQIRKHPTAAGKMSLDSEGT